MKRTLLNVVVVVPLLVATFLLGVRYGGSAHGQSNRRDDVVSKIFCADRLVGLRELQSLFGEVSEQACSGSSSERTFSAPGRWRVSEEHNVQMKYPCVEWDDVKKCFLFDGQPVRKECFHYFIATRW